jgi:hypothetical protein
MGSATFILARTLGFIFIIPLRGLGGKRPDFLDSFEAIGPFRIFSCQRTSLKSLFGAAVPFQAFNVQLYGVCFFIE